MNHAQDKRVIRAVPGLSGESRWTALGSITIGGAPIPVPRHYIEEHNRPRPDRLRSIPLLGAKVAEVRDFIRREVVPIEQQIDEEDQIPGPVNPPTVPLDERWETILL